MASFANPSFKKHGSAFTPSHGNKLSKNVPKNHNIHHIKRLSAIRSQMYSPPPGLSQLPWIGDDKQLKALEQLRQSMSTVPIASRLDEDTLKWFLLDRKLDPIEAQEKLIKMLTWRKSINADDLKTTDIAKEAATGKAYLHPHLDLANRPVVIVRVSRHFIGGSPPEESQQLCAYTLDRAIEKLPGGDNNTILGIFDLRGFTPRNADFIFARFLVDAFFTYYPKRVSQVLFVEAPWIFQPAWEVVKPWLRKYAALVRFVSVDELRREYFTVETLPEDFKQEPFPRWK